MAMETMVGNGAKDRWLFGQRIEDFAPLLVAAVPSRKANKPLYSMAWLITVGSEIYRELSQLGSLLDL